MKGLNTKRIKKNVEQEKKGKEIKET